MSLQCHWVFHYKISALEPNKALGQKFLPTALLIDKRLAPSVSLHGDQLLVRDNSQHVWDFPMAYV